MTSIFKEYKQLHDMNTFVRVCPNDLTPKQKQDALHDITLIEDKRCKKVKGTVCADGIEQR